MLNFPTTLLVLFLLSSTNAMATLSGETRSHLSSRGSCGFQLSVLLVGASCAGLFSTLSALVLVLSAGSGREPNGAASGSALQLPSGLESGSFFRPDEHTLLMAGWYCGAGRGRFNLVVCPHTFTRKLFYLL